MKRLVTTVLSLCLMVPLSVQAEEAKHMLDANTLDNVRKVAPAPREIRAGAARRPVAASRPGAARPQHRHPGGDDRPQPDRGYGGPARACARQWRQAGRDLGDHHASRLLFRLVERHGGGRPRRRMSSPAATSGPISSPPRRRRCCRSTRPRRHNRANRVGQQFGATFPGVVQYTTDVLFRDLWLRPDLAPRDRSLVTISALVAAARSLSLPPISTWEWITG